MLTQQTHAAVLVEAEDVESRQLTFLITFDYLAFLTIEKQVT